MSTVRWWLKGSGLTACSPSKGPLLTAAHRRRRLEFAREDMNWTIDEWKNILFMDETRMCLHGKDGINKVYISK